MLEMVCLLLLVYGDFDERSQGQGVSSDHHRERTV